VGRLSQFYFRPAPECGMPSLSGVAVIRDDEYRKLTLPKGWGSWDQAIDIKLEDEG
jgi:hypothetical protein